MLLSKIKGTDFLDQIALASFMSRWKKPSHSSPHFVNIPQLEELFKRHYFVFAWSKSLFIYHKSSICNAIFNKLDFFEFSAKPAFSKRSTTEPPKCFSVWRGGRVSVFSKFCFLSQSCCEQLNTQRKRNTNMATHKHTMATVQFG